MGAAAPRAAPRARGGIAHRPVLGDLELVHANYFGMRHVMRSEKLNAVVNTYQDTREVEI